METIYSIFGRGEDLSILQMSARASIMFFITLALIRFGGMRIFGKKSVFDDILVIMLGAVLTRGIVGASPFWGTVAAAVIMVVIHRALALLSIINIKAAKFLKGETLPLYHNGEINWKNMRRSAISKEELMQSLRLETKKQSLEDVETAFMETNGRISFILKKANG